MLSHEEAGMHTYLFMQLSEHFMIESGLFPLVVRDIIFLNPRG